MALWCLCHAHGVPHCRALQAIKHLERVLEISREMGDYVGDADAYGVIVSPAPPLFPLPGLLAGVLAGRLARLLSICMRPAMAQGR